MSPPPPPPRRPPCSGAACARLLAAAAAASVAAARATDCWEECERTGLYCEEFCCQPPDGFGNPACWDGAGIFSFARCCSAEPPLEPAEPPKLALGRLDLELYRGPSDHNSPRYNERTVEVALGLWFMRASLARIKEEGGHVPLEIGNVLGSYWPAAEKLRERYLPWIVADLGDNGVDATTMSFEHHSVLSLSTVEHIGYDNEGSTHFHGFRVDDSPAGLEAWVRSWDAAPALLERIAAEAAVFLVTFPVGFNPRLDSAVARRPSLRRWARVVKRVDALNRWQLDESNNSFGHHYDFRDTYSQDHIAHMFHPGLPPAYRRVFAEDMPPRLLLPRHPRFRFANGVCIVTNVPEILGS